MKLCRCCEACVGTVYLLIFLINFIGVRKRYCCVCLRYAGSYNESDEMSEKPKDISITIDKNDAQI
jgi:hypothetical protein